MWQLDLLFQMMHLGVVVIWREYIDFSFDSSNITPLPVLESKEKSTTLTVPSCCKKPIDSLGVSLTSGVNNLHSNEPTCEILTLPKRFCTISYTSARVRDVSP